MKSTTSSDKRVLLAVVAAGLVAVALLALQTTPLANQMAPRLMGLAGLLAVAFVGLGVWLQQRQQATSAASHYLDALQQLEYSDLLDNRGLEKLPVVDAANPWTPALDGIRARMSELSERIQVAEHGRTSAEVRARRMASQHEQVTGILAGLADPVLAIDHFDELILANPSAEKLFELGSDEASSRAVGQLVACQELVDLLTDTRRRRTPSQRTGEIEFVDDRGQQHWFRVCCRSLAGEAGDEADATARGAVAVLRDIGGQRATQRRNAEFVSAVSHEMKTPLAGIKAYVELLADGDAEDPETRDEFLDVINSQADRLQRLIDNLLNLARIEAGVVNVSKQTRSLNDLLEEAVSVVQPAAEHKSIELRRDLSPMYLAVYADRDMLLQCAINLLSNAIKYTASGGTVTLHSRLDEDSKVVFEVSDSGVGLSAEDCERVFDKFYRVKANTKMAPGTGLGLPLARHIVEDVHGGHLTVESQLGEGSTFRVTMPTDKAVNAARLTT